MDLARYDSLNEKLGLCYKYLNGDYGKITQEDKKEVEAEAEQYKKEMNILLKEV